MKYIVMIGDGMADRPLKELNGKTPLQSAVTPNMDRLAREGIIGKIRTIPAGFHPGSDIANLNILGYNPQEFYSGRAPLEAASIGISMKEDDVAYRCNLVTLKYNKDKTKAVMDDYSSGHISTDEAEKLVLDINQMVGNKDISFYPGVSYRHIMLWSSGETKIECTPPHDITGKEISDYLPVGNGEDMLRDLMLKSAGILENHPVKAPILAAVISLVFASLVSRARAPAAEIGRPPAALAAAFGKAVRPRRNCIKRIIGN